MIQTFRLSVLRAVVVCLVALSGTASSAWAATYTVTTTTDRASGSCAPGDCSLREAILAANNNAGPDQIDLDPNQLFSLTLGELPITGSLTINANGSTIDAGSLSRVLHITGTGVVVVIDRVTISGGVTAGFLQPGGGILVEQAALTLTNATVTGNSTVVNASFPSNGGGIAAVGTYGGNIATLAQLTLTNTVVTGNAGLNGGGIACVLCALTIQTNSQVTANTATGADGGGGIDIVGDASTVSVTGSLVSLNAATAASPRGGGVSIPVGMSSPSLAFNRIVSNTGGSTGAIFNGEATVTAANNWWGCNNGPGAAATNCAAAPNAVSGTVTSAPYLQLVGTATPSAMQAGAHATITGDLIHNSVPSIPSGGAAPDGTSIGFTTDSGTLAAASAVTAAGTASVDFQAGGSTTTVNLTVALDGQTVPFSLHVDNPPTITPIGPQTIDEDTATGDLQFTIGDIDGDSLGLSWTATNPSLIGSVTFGGSGSARTVTVTPAPNKPTTFPSDSSTITITVSDGFLSTSTSFVLTVNAVNDSPTLNPLNDMTIAEDAAPQTVSLANITAGGGESQALTVTATSSNPALVPNPSVTYTSPASTGSIAVAPAANKFGGPVTITVTVTDELNASSSRTFAVNVTPVADTPSITGATTNEDTQTTTGLVVTPNAADGPEVTHFKITAISGGSLFQNDGSTPIAAGAFITIAEGAAGLRFSPTPDSIVTGHVTVQASIGAADAGLGGSAVTADITIVPIADAPAVTPSTTAEDTQTTSGLVISRNAADGAEVTHFKISAITSGSLFQNDGTTPIASGAVITLAQGSAGLRFTPAANFFGTASFVVQGATSAAGDGTGASTIASITVTAVADTPSITGATTNEDTQTTSGLVIAKNAADGVEVTHVKIVSVTGGSLFQNDGTTPIGAGAFITIADGAAGLRFTPAANSIATGHVTVQASIGASDAGLGGAPVTADITILPVADVPSVTSATTPEDTQTTSGLVISRNAADGPEVTHFKITAIANGTLFQHDGTTPIADGAFITFAQGNAGLRFTPAADVFGAAGFVVQGATSAAGDGLSPSASATITITPVADTPSMSGASTIVNAQTASGLVVSRNPADGAEVTHVKILAVSGGSLYQHDGATPIAAGSFITIAEGAAGLRFTPAPDSAATGHVTIQASTSSADAGLGGSPVTADISIGVLTSSTGVVTSGSPSNPGDLVTFTATVAPSQAASGGTVQFMDGGTALGTPVAVSGGTAALATSSLAAGLHQISAVYSGNSLTGGSTGVLAGGQLVRTGTGVMLTPSANPALLGDAVTIQATPTHAGGGTATGTVTVTEASTTLATLTLAGGTASFTSSSFGAGTHHLVGTYSGDGSFAPATAAIDLVVACPVMTIAPVAIAPVVTNQPYSQTFTVTGVGPGSVTFALTGTLPSGLTFDAATATISGLTPTPGNYPITLTVTRANGCGAASASYALVVAAGRVVLTGADAGGGPHVRRFTALDGGVPPSGALTSFFAFNTGFTGGVRVAEGDVNADGQPDYITAVGAGAPPEVRIYDGATGALLRSFMAYEPGFLGGVYVAAADVDGDGFVDVITGSGPGRSGEVKVFSGRDGSLLRDLNVFSPAFTGGVRVAAGDVNGDGIADLIAGTGPGAASVTVLNGADGSTLATVSPYGGLTGGVFVAAGDVNGDGYADVITGAGEGGPPQVRVLDVHNGNAVTLTFNAFDAAFLGGVRVAAGDVTGDGHAEIIAGSGPGRAATVRVFDAVTTAQISEVQPYGGYLGGLFVATTAPLSEMVIDSPQPGSVAGTFTLSGWAFEDSGSTAGLSGIDVTALPVGGGPAIALGSATLGDSRPDVAAIFGAAYTNAGFHLAVTGLAPGAYDLRITARRAGSGNANLTRTVRVTVRPAPAPVIFIDTPRAGRQTSGTFAVAGWALLPEQTASTGIDAVDVWALPVGGGAGRLVGAAALGIARPDIAALFGSQYLSSGFQVTVTNLPVGTWDIEAFPHAVGAAAFGAPAIVRVTIGPARAIATGADAGAGPQVQRFDALSGGPPSSGALNSFLAFNAAFTGGVRVAEGDVNGDGIPDTIAGAGPGGSPEVRIYDGATGALRAAFLAFDPAFRGGVFVAAGDVNGDGTIDVIVGSGEGRAGEVKVFDGRDLSVLRDVSVFGSFTGGVHVAAGDVNGDGLADLVAGTGPGVAAQVLVLNAADGTTLRTLNPYGAFLGGVYVAAGDVTGDGFADIVTGAGAGGGPHVQVFDGVTGNAVLGFFAFEPGFAGGVRVAAGDVTGDGRAELIVGSGGGRPATVRVFDATNAAQISETQPYGAGAATGLYVATAAPINRMAIDTPAPNASVHGAFTIAGWGYIENASTAGVSALHVWAMPVGGGAPVFVGAATLGDARPDVAALYGPGNGHAGFHLSAGALPPGVYDLVFSAQSALTGTFEVVRVVRVTVTP